MKHFTKNFTLIVPSAPKRKRNDNIPHRLTLRGQLSHLAIREIFKQTVPERENTQKKNNNLLSSSTAEILKKKKIKRKNKMKEEEERHIFKNLKSFFKTIKKRKNKKSRDYLIKNINKRAKKKRNLDICELYYEEMNNLYRRSVLLTEKYHNQLDKLEDAFDAIGEVVERSFIERESLHKFYDDSSELDMF